MLVHIEYDTCWGNAISDDKNEGELSVFSYGIESLDRLAVALGEYWKIRYAAVTAIEQISEGCSR
ncbi:hypothetical protein H5410_054448 [Solanum commersonii]|uniref:Uncharacterized protein n=1 Tax=Solanum commersonii TaxID=4109 RepID=A0A9J5WFC5_SOLCO|nr:hypothetical protein H5410_054448 [Solanum commersonii]